MSELDLYDYDLPEELIARQPPPQREDARLLVLHRTTGAIEHRSIRDLPEYLQKGDCLVFNNTEVLPARLQGYREQTGGKWEGLFLRALDENRWLLLGQTRGKLQPGETVCLTPIHASADLPPLRLELLSRDEEGNWTVRPDSVESYLELLKSYGSVPLPPYIEREKATAEDFARYQTTYASQPGAVAAPTAGLHFTPELIERCRAKGVNTTNVTLHVGIGTFRPITAERLDQHVMHSEWCRLAEDSARILRETKQSGGRIVAVGTTSVRTLESAAAGGEIQAWEGETRIFIRPPYEFQAVDVLLTNFHLPKSTLLVLLSALAGRELVLKAYQEAIAQRYRFFSYGDGMLVL